jgi:hypothetical protein
MLEENILFFSDAYGLYGPGPKFRDISGARAFLQESDIRIRDVSKNEALEEWQLEAASVDRATQILPGVRRIIDSIPDGRYAVATSARKKFGNFSYFIFT